MSLSTFSQNGLTSDTAKYPKMMLMGGDTVVVITPDQVKKVNIVKVERDNFKELADSLESTLDVCLENDSTKTLELESKNKQLVYQDSIIENDSIMVKNLEETRDILECHLEAEKEKKKILGIIAGTEGVVIVILGILLLL